MKRSLAVIALLGAGSALAYFYVAAQTYYPVVKLASPDGLTYSVVQDGNKSRSACGDANASFLRPVRQHCPQCVVVYARCERRLQGTELALAADTPLPHYRVVGGGVRIAVQGPADKVRAACDEIASDIVRGGVPTAACVFPNPAAKS